ncbi:ABC transporter substrate-binding protein [Priestia koreensis]|uniref:ABC transporter substrate-binding protein n=1 Tax=Priestia koreensis TaxID=284581 RepID=UPI003458340D
MFKKFKVYALVLFLVAFLAACGNSGQDASPKKDSGDQKQEQAFPLTKKDAAGNEITLKKKPTKIISLMPSNTEILFALGLDKEVAGVTTNDTYPEAATKKEKVGDMNVNVEKIISMQPDLVLAQGSSMGMSGEAYKQLGDAGVPVFVVEEAKSFDQVYDTIETVGELTGKEKEASNIVDDMKQDVKDVKDKASSIKKEDRKKVWVEVSGPPEIYTTGKGTFMDEMLSTIGADNVAGDQEGWVKLSEEKAVQLNPDAIITTYGAYTKGAVEQLLSRPAWKNVTAVKDKAVTDVDGDLVTRPGPRLAEGLKEIAKAVYPDVYK